MDEKIKKLAVKIEGLIDYHSHQMVFDQLGDVARKQREYFEYLGPDNFIKLSIYIFSLKETNDFKLGEKILDKLMFSKLVTTEGNLHVSQCDECEGSGELNCDYCGGNAKINCQTCEGSGELMCPECDGDGRQMGDGEWEDCEECEGTGSITCSDCGGDGETDCGDCDRGTIECEYCEGSGEIESVDKVDYQSFFIASWSKNINDACELKVGEPSPAFSEFTFDVLRDNFIILSIDESYAPLDIRVNEMYCTFYSDEPKLEFGSKMQIETYKNVDLRYLYK